MSAIQTVSIDNKNYKVFNGIYYHEDTPNKLIELIDRFYRNRQRVSIYYGDTKNGNEWGDVEIGRIGRTTGTIKIPISVHNARSLGGSAILTNCIVKITTTTKDKSVLYRVS